MIPKVNDRVIMNDSFKESFDCFFKGVDSHGVITEVDVWEGELTAENHGIVEIKFDCGFVEHFCIFGFYDCFDNE